jgi:hypothetical protein
MTYLPSLGNVDNNVYLPWAYLLIDLSATCQHLISFKLNDINWTHKNFEHSNEFKITTFPFMIC